MDGLYSRCEILEDNATSIVKHANRLQRNMYTFSEYIGDEPRDNVLVAEIITEVNDNIQGLLALISGTIAVLRDTVEENL